LGKLLKNKRVWPFEVAVDPKALQLGDYKKIVKKPMDLGTVGKKLEEGRYKNLEESGEEFYSDVVLTFDNALRYNPEGDEIWEHAASLKASFEELWARMLEPVAVADSSGNTGARNAASATPSDSAKTHSSAGKPASKAASQQWQEWARGVLQKVMKAAYSKGFREPLDAQVSQVHHVDFLCSTHS